MRIIRTLTLLCGAGLVAGAALAASESPPPLGPSSDRSPAAGKRLYRDGVLPSGRPVQATIRRDVSVAGPEAACGTCHRRSGLGSSEGGTVNRPITGDALYQARAPYSLDSGPSGAEASGTPRPAYTDETLARAVRDGIDSAGRALNPLMPRYALEDRDMGLLISYLNTLSASASPGVTATTVHFATVMADGAEPDVRKGMLDVLDAYVRDKSADTRSETRRSQVHRAHESKKYRAYRKWALHVWELKGPRESWSAQLEAQYRRQPVFAILSGTVTGGWEPVHRFCEQFEVPCLFPHTDLPAISESDFYTVYASKGMTLEAEALAVYLASTRGATAAGRILQVFRNDEDGRVPALVLREALRRAGIGEVRDRILAGAERPTADFWTELLNRERPSALVLWLHDPALAELDRATGASKKPGEIYLSSSLTMRHAPAVPERLTTAVRWVHPFDRPESWDRNLQRAKVWMRSRRVEVTDLRAQANAFLAATVAGEALMHIENNLSRNYFLERIEHGLENVVATSVYPHLSLGPGQRYASKGCQILAHSGEASGALSPVSGWIVP